MHLAKPFVMRTAPADTLKACKSLGQSALSALIPPLQDLFDQGCEPEQMNVLLRRLNCAALHSRAAYGYAMAAGHLSSLVNFALLQTVSLTNSRLPSCTLLAMHTRLLHSSSKWNQRKMLTCSAAVGGT